MFDDFFARKRLGKLLGIAVQTTQTGNFNTDNLVKELSSGREDVDLVRSYIVIQTACQLTGNPVGSDVDEAYKTLRASEKHLDEPAFGEILDIHRELAEIFADQKRVAVRAGRPHILMKPELQRQVSGLQRRLDSLLEGL